MYPPLLGCSSAWHLWLCCLACSGILRKQHDCALGIVFLAEFSGFLSVSLSLVCGGHSILLFFFVALSQVELSVSGMGIPVAVLLDRKSF
jgi:hypothetical protein